MTGKNEKRPGAATPTATTKNREHEIHSQYTTERGACQPKNEAER